MKAILYASKATRRFSGAMLDVILRQSKRNNSPLEISGLLLYANGTFMQLLEGPEPAVEATFHKIGRDPRHTDIRCLYRGPIEQRLFGGWKMGFINLDFEPNTTDRDRLLQALNADFGERDRSSEVESDLRKSLADFARQARVPTETFA